MKRLFIVSITIGAIAALAAMVFLIDLRTPADSTDLVEVRLKWLHQAQFAGFYVAENKGFYRSQGLAVALNPGGVDFPAVTMIAGGSEHFGVTGADQILLARSKGIPIVAVAMIYRSTPFVLFSLKESGIDQPADFIGKKIGVKLGGNEELTYRAILRATGVSSADLIEIPVKYDMSRLFSKAVDVWPGYSINEPISAREKGFDVTIIHPRDYGVDIYADTLFTTEQLIREQPELVRGFVESTILGWEYAKAHPEEAAQITLGYSELLNLPHEMAMMQESIPLLAPDSKPLGSMELERWAELQELLLDAGFLLSPVELESAFTTDFLQ